MRTPCGRSAHTCPPPKHTEYTVRMPAPLVAWAARWEVATRCDQIKLLQVQVRLKTGWWAGSVHVA